MSRYTMLTRSLVLVAAVATTAAATPAFAARTKTITTTNGGSQAQCTGTGDKWVFRLSGVGPGTGIQPPASISARTAGGATRKVPLAKVQRSENQTPSSAYYELVSTAKLTGKATARIGSASTKQAAPAFNLVSGPCATTVLTVDVSQPTVARGGKITIKARLTDASGSPVAGRKGEVRLQSLRRSGKGQRFDLPMTDAGGRTSLTVTADDPGTLDFKVRMRESGPTQRAGNAAERAVSIWSVAESLPVSSGTLASSAGAALLGGGRTVVSGTGFAPHTEVALLIYSEPRLLTVAKTNKSGAFSEAVTIPSDLSGRHTLIAVGESAGRGPALRYLTLPVTVGTLSMTVGGAPIQPAPVASTQLPVTGSSASVFALGGTVLLGTGLALLLGLRRRPRSTTD